MSNPFSRLSKYWNSHLYGSDSFGAGGSGPTTPVPFTGGDGRSGQSMPTSSNPYTPSFRDPTAPPTGELGDPADPSTLGWLKQKLGDVSFADWLRAGGAAIGAYQNYEGQQQNRAQTAAELAERKREYDANLAQRQSEYGRSTGDTEAQAAVRAQTELNKAPLADKAQALLLARMGSPPTALHPRDFTQPGGISDTLQTPATGGPADALAAGEAAANAYTPGSGGVDTSTTQALLRKLRGSSGLDPQNASGAGGVDDSTIQALLRKIRGGN